MDKDIWMTIHPYFAWLSRVCLGTLLFASCFVAYPQNVTETRWYFGNTQENLVFDRNGRDSYLETTQATPFGSAGAVTITDQFTGNLLFYTDGSQIFDASHTLIPTGTPLNGDPTINVPVVTAPVIGSPGQYYLFSNSGAGGVNEIQVSIVDATVAGNGTAQFPLGDLTATINQGTGLTNPAEAMLIIPLGDGETFWLLSQDRVNFDIRVTEINNGGIGATTNYNFTNGTTPGFAASHFAFSPDTSLLAMVPQTANRNLWIMDFDPATGVPTFNQQLIGTGVDDGAGESIYDVEWSRDGTKLYYSRFGGAGDVGNIFQFNLTDTTGIPINPILPAAVNRSYGLKRGIDNRIYHLYQQAAGGQFTLGRINRPDSIPDSVNYQPMVFDVDFDSRQFPEFTPGYNFTFNLLEFTYIDSCLENVTKFFPTIEPIPQNVRWDFGDGISTNAFVPLYTYQAEGGYMVSLTAELNGITQTVTQPVEILANDLMVDLGNDTTICVDEILTLDAGVGESFVWNTGELTQTIDVDTAGTYWVEVTNATGCTDFDDIEVTEYGVSNQISNQWYFGEQAGIEFTGGAVAITDGNNQFATEGCATISDINGDLLFYTNGFTIWNREHNVMVNGDTIGGDLAAAQSSLILPFSGDQTMFYVFTTESVYGDGEYALKYTIVDMKKDEGRGAVVVKDIKMMENSSERITASGFTGNDILLAREFGNNTFRAFGTTAVGLSSAIYSPSGEVHQFVNELSATGYMKFSPSVAQVALNVPGTNQVEILDFDVATGAVSNPRVINTGETGLYGLEFSNAGTKLYLTTTGANSKLIQYDLDSLNSADPSADIEATKFDGYPQGTDYGALQTGPDGVIYMAVDNSGTIGQITSGDADDAGAGFNPTGFDLAGRTSRLGLPNFAQNQSPPLQTPSISVTAGCTGQESSFSGVGRDNSIENYLWRFGDGQSSTDQSTTHTYANPGIYTVELELSNRCDVDTVLTQTIEVFNIPQSPTVPPDSALCDSPVVLEAWPVDTAVFSYYWSTGDTTRQITVVDPAVIDVAIINNVTGCSSDTLTVFLADARPPIDLGPDRLLCQNDPTITLDALVPNAVYEWAVNGTVLGNNRTFDITTTTPGSFEYTVSITNSFGCIGRDTLQVDISPQPDILVTPTATSGCGNADGVIDITFNSAGSYTYQVTGPSSFGPANFDGPGAAPSITGLAAGSYTVTVSNIVTGCVALVVTQVSDPGTFNFTPTSVGGICNGTVQIELSPLPASLDYSYTVFDSAGNIATSGTGSTASITVPTSAPFLDPGTYFIEVQDNVAPNCLETQQITIAPGADPAFTFDAIQEICGVSGDALVTDGTGGVATYSWTGPGGFTGTGTTVTVSTPGTYTVTASGPGFCDRPENIEVVFNTDPIVDVVVSGDPCLGQVTLIANVSNGSGSYVFSWSDGAQAQQNTVSVSGTYTVNVVDQLTSCAATSGPVDVEIQQNFEVVLTLEPDCENNENVFLIATTNYFDPNVTYAWSNGNGDVLAETDSILTVSISDTYTVVATNENGACTATDNFSVAVVPILDEELTLPERASFCTADPVSPTVDLDPGQWNSYEWRLLPDPTIISTDRVLTVASEGTYEVTIFNGFTCRTDEVLVEEDCRPVVFAPNAFSPNGNGVNEEFFVFPNPYVDSFEIFIYSRWGELVYYSNLQDFRWNGTFRGTLLPVGTYAYILKFSSTLEPALGTIEQYGSVTLIR